MPGARYYVMGTVSLTPPNWVPISSNITATASELTYCVPWPSSYHFFQLAEGLLTQNPFVITGLSSAPGGFRMQWRASLDKRFGVQWTPSMSGPGWNNFTNVVTSTNDQYEFLDDGSQTGGMGPARFYRLLEWP